MATPFAALEARSTAAVFRHLVNEAATRTPAAGGAAAPVDVIFDAAYRSELDDMVAAYGPAVLFPTSAAPGAARNDVWVVRGVTYQAAEVMPDGTGVTAVRLRQ